MQRRSHLSTLSTSTVSAAVPSIGPATADKILQARKSHGSFKSIDDLQAIKGLGPTKLEKMRKCLTVGKARSAAEASRASRDERKAYSFGEG